MGVKVGLVLTLLALTFEVHCEVFPECDGVESKTFVPDSNDCESYIYCDDEESYVSKCPDEQRFNGELGICDEADNVECFSEETTTQQTTSPKSSSSTRKSSTKSSPSTLASSTSTATTRATSSTTQTKDQIVCPTPSKPDEITYMPNSKSCSEYYMCFNKTPISMTCPKDLEFNASTSSCDWAASANCKIAGTTTPSPRELCAGNKSGYFEYANNCRYYYRCMRGLLTIQECPSGFGWDPNKKMCSSAACKRGF